MGGVHAILAQDPRTNLSEYVEIHLNTAAMGAPVSLTLEPP